MVTPHVVVDRVWILIHSITQVCGQVKGRSGIPGTNHQRMQLSPEVTSRLRTSESGLKRLKRACHLGSRFAIMHALLAQRKMEIQQAIGRSLSTWTRRFQVRLGLSLIVREMKLSNSTFDLNPGEDFKPLLSR